MKAVFTVSASKKRPPGLFHHAQYWMTVATWPQLPPAGPPEIAFAGRSNAGKSSAINALANENRLAFVSKSPGRTRQINLFRLRNGALLADLPGYGYAEAPRDIKQTWEALLGRYLSSRESLCGMIIIMDIRHPLTELDWRMLDWFGPSGKPVHVLLNKADKLSTMRARARLAQVFRDIAGRASVQLFSSTRKEGIAEVEQLVEGWLQRWHDRPFAEASGVAPGEVSGIL